MLEASVATWDVGNIILELDSACEVSTDVGLGSETMVEKGVMDSVGALDGALPD
jgi:hypothetical protein